MNYEQLEMLVASWRERTGVHTTQELLEWVEERNAHTYVKITRNRLTESGSWYMDDNDHVIKNVSGGFFSICGLVSNDAQNYVVASQPIIVQDEIGFLGIICKKIGGILHFLMQAKIEPGNINKIQISPTIQATRSNFMQLHQGRKPMYLEYFINASKYEIIVDQIQSEQSSRFFKKRNRNIIIWVDEEIECSPYHRWMTLGQIKALLRYNNMVNMDTRTVLSCIPFAQYLSEDERRTLAGQFAEEGLFNSVFFNDEQNSSVFHQINNAKMFDHKDVKLVGLDKLSNWSVTDEHIYCNEPSNFEVIFCEIEIEGREVMNWSQPLFMATGLALFGIFTAVIEGTYKYLVRLTPEVGCFDQVELGPTAQMEYRQVKNRQTDSIGSLFLEKLESKSGILYDVLLSEEGGRFYHEQNRNVIIKIDAHEVEELPAGYFWMSYAELNRMVQFNNILNIQLRNLLSLLEVQ